MAAGPHGQDGDNARDLAVQDCRPESGSAQTRHPVMVERNVWDLLNNIKIVCFIDAQVIITGCFNVNVVTLAHQTHEPALTDIAYVQFNFFGVF